MANYSKLSSSITLILNDLPVYGGSRLGVYNKSGNFTNYQLTDHLGNVRAVIRKNGTSTTPLLQQYADYYPFGEQLPLRNSFGGYLYAYQGQELDPETGMEAFKLRLWDGRIGRWLSPDPYGQYASPYLGMGNNPVSMIDPDGGWADGGGWWQSFKNWLFGNNQTKPITGTAVAGPVESIEFNPEDDFITSGAYPLPTPTNPYPTNWRIIPGDGGLKPNPGPGLATRVAPILLGALFYTPDSSPYSPTNMGETLSPEGVDRNGDIAVMRVQLQKGNLNISSMVAINSREVGVTTLQADVALIGVREEARGIEKKLISTQQAIHAFAKMSKKIKTAPGYGGIIPGTRTTLQETFLYKGETFRIDVESLRGHNLRK